MQVNVILSQVSDRSWRSYFSLLHDHCMCFTVVEKSENMLQFVEKLASMLHH